MKAWQLQDLQRFTRDRQQAAQDHQLLSRLNPKRRRHHLARAQQCVKDIQHLYRSAREFKNGSNDKH